jgi:hypothetical protein
MNFIMGGLLLLWPLVIAVAHSIWSVWITTYVRVYRRVYGSENELWWAQELSLGFACLSDVRMSLSPTCKNLSDS